MTYIYKSTPGVYAADYRSCAILYAPHKMSLCIESLSTTHTYYVLLTHIHIYQIFIITGAKFSLAKSMPYINWSFPNESHAFSNYVSARRRYSIWGCGLVSIKQIRAIPVTIEYFPLWFTPLHSSRLLQFVQTKKKKKKPISTNFIDYPTWLGFSRVHTWEIIPFTTICQNTYTLNN